MMSRFLLAAGMLASSILSPLTAHAYMAPEDVLNDEDFTATYFSPPPSRREINTVLEEQQKRSAERRAAEHAALAKEGAAEEEELHGAAGEEGEGGIDNSSSNDAAALLKALQDLQDAQKEDSATSTEELREQRLLERIRQQQLEALTAGGTLHSGAPLSETGPATVLVFLAVAGAVAETWRRVRRAERRKF